LSYVDEKTPEDFVYEVLGLAAALRVKGHKLAVAEVGEGGLGGRMLKDLRAETALG
jgi:hypothetical protein